MNSTKKIIFTIGGKGGTGKTTLMTALAEWFTENDIPCAMLDLDTENKAKGSFVHFFGDRTKKVDIQSERGLDVFLDTQADIILADMGAGSGKVSYAWFNELRQIIGDDMSFTAIGMVTSDPASVESVLSWAGQLQDGVSYLVVLNKHKDPDEPFVYWEETEAANRFRKTLHPAAITMDYRITDLQNAARNHGVTLGMVARRECDACELQGTSVVIRAQAYRRRLFGQFDSVREVLLP